MRFLSGTLFALLASAAVADEVTLVNGDVISDCKVTDLGDSFQVVKGPASRTIPKADVRRIEYRETSGDIYVKRAAALKAADLDGHLQLARWCVERRLAKESEAEFRKVVALQPEHEEARIALGFKRHEGRWLTGDEYAQAQGLVRFRGRWVSPQERDLTVALEERREVERRLALEARRWLDAMASPDEARRKQATEALAGFEDAVKVKPLIDHAHGSSPHVRQYVAAELGRIGPALGDPAWAASKAMARRAVWDGEPEIRSAALTALRAIAHEDAALALTPYLSEEAREARLRTEDALGHFRDWRSIAPLSNILVNIQETLQFIEQHEKLVAQIIRNTLILKDGRRVQVPANLRISPTVFDPEGRRRLEEERTNVLEALGALTGQSLGDDAARWRSWAEKMKAERKK